jgi:hypothetical protein
MHCKKIKWTKTVVILLTILLFPILAVASEASAGQAIVDFTKSIYGYMGVFIFVAAYSLVPLEHNIHLRKSKPVLLAAGVYMWTAHEKALISSLKPLVGEAMANEQLIN